MGEGLYAKFFGGGTQEKELEKPATGPIVACVGPEKSFGFKDRRRLEKMRPVSVDWFGGEEEWNVHEQKNGGKFSYVISKVDAENKFSEGYVVCTGVAAVGFDRMTGKNISLLTHENSKSVRTEEFRNHLVERLAELAHRSDIKNIDAVIFGGSYPMRSSRDDKDEIDIEDEGKESDAYRRAIEILRSAVTETLGIDPHIVAGPNTNVSSGDWRPSEVRVVLDTQRRRLYVVRPEQPGQGETNVSFPASQLEKEEEKWKKHESK